jgi:hypothetical protein
VPLLELDEASLRGFGVRAEPGRVIRHGGRRGVAHHRPDVGSDGRWRDVDHALDLGAMASDERRQAL